MEEVTTQEILKEINEILINSNIKYSEGRKILKYFEILNNTIAKLQEDKT